MPIDRFKVLLQCLHVNDNTTAKSRNDPNYDRLHKIRPLLNMSRDNFMHEYNIDKEVSIDEAMVGFKGRSSLKQYMPLKPTKRGYKVWCQCDSHNGYLYNFDIYAGASGSRADGDELGVSVVKKLIDPLMGHGYFVFCDNFFSSVTLANELLKKGTYLFSTT